MTKTETYQFIGTWKLWNPNIRSEKMCDIKGEMFTKINIDCPSRGRHELINDKLYELLFIIYWYEYEYNMWCLPNGWNLDWSSDKVLM